MNIGKLVLWIESGRHGYYQTGRIPRWQRVMLWLTKPLRHRFYFNKFSKAIVIVRSDATDATPIPPSSKKWTRMPASSARASNE